MPTESTSTEPVSDPTFVLESVAMEATENKAAPTATATKKPAPKQRAKKSPAKKKQRVAKKKPAVQKRVAKQPTVKKKKSDGRKLVTKKSPAKKKKRGTKKSPAKRVAVKKTVAKKAAAKKRPGKKSVARAITAKKSVVKKRAVKKTVAKKPAPRKAETQPNANGVNKAQAIRDMAKDLGGTPRPRDVIAALAAQGITVVSAQVSTVLKTAGLRKNPKTNATIGKGRSHGLNSDQLFHVKALVDQLGGIDKLSELLSALERLL